jgi:hypothetical protein
MKKILFVLLGAFLALMAIVIAVHMDLVTIWFGVLCAYGAYRSFRAARSPRT